MPSVRSMTTIAEAKYSQCACALGKKKIRERIATMHVGEIERVAENSRAKIQFTSSATLS